MTFKVFSSTAFLREFLSGTNFFTGQGIKNSCLSEPSGTRLRTTGLIPAVYEEER